MTNVDFYSSCEERTCDTRWCYLLDKKISCLTFTDRVALHLFICSVSVPDITSKVGDTYSVYDIDCDTWLDMIEDSFEIWVDNNTRSIYELQHKLDKRITKAMLWIAINMSKPS